MLDTNTVSYVLRGRSQPARERLAGLKHGESACLSSITEAELRYEIAKRPGMVELARAVDLFLAKIEVLPWRREEARIYGLLRATQEATGKTLGNLDLLIAAHAVAAGAVLVTNDKAFLQVEALKATENWVAHS